MLRRFFVEAELKVGAEVKLPPALARRLGVVLRGESRVGLFNGESGLVEAEVAGKSAKVLREVEPFRAQPKLELWLGLPKREAVETCLRMATELGVTRVVPLLTDFVVKKEINDERARAIVIEACEQCERLDMPGVEPVRKLSDALAGRTEKLAWAASREVPGRVSLTVNGPVPSERKERSASPLRTILIGPEGGFSPVEEKLLLGHAAVVPVSLGATILRVDTAVAAGLARLK